MFRKTRWLSFALVAGLVLGLGCYAAAQDLRGAVVKPSIAEGTYRDLTWWRKVKLGTAPFFNPRLAEQAAVAYKYDPQAFLDAEAWDAAFSLFKGGDLAVATVEQGGDYVVDFDLNEKIEVYDSLIDAVKSLEALGLEVVFIGQGEDIPGLDAKNIRGINIVSWDAKETKMESIQHK